VGKIDYNLSANHRLSGAINEYPVTLTFNSDAFCGLGFSNTSYDCAISTPNNRNQEARITETWTVSPTVVNEFRIGAMREHDQYAGGAYGKGYLQKLGIQPQYGTNAPADAFPNIQVDAGTSLGGGNSLYIGTGPHANLVEDMYNASDVVTLIRGKHSIKLGGELDRMYQHDTTWGDSSSGNFEFNGVGTKSGTSVDPRTGAASNGVPFADFLLGNTYGWFLYNGDATNAATWLTSGFVNDDFKVTPRLTLNLGLRYQHQTGWAVADGRFGPDLTHLMSRETIAAGAALNNRENLRLWVKDPDAIKPGSLMPAMQLNDQELDAVTAVTLIGYRRSWWASKRRRSGIRRMIPCLGTTPKS
jgi:hypothetical protein